MKALLTFLVCLALAWAQDCPEGKVYQECGTACPLTCDNYNDAPLTCTLECVSGCFCPTGEVEKGDECVEPSECSVFCEYQDARYEPGDEFPAGDGCNTCTCGDDGTVACTELPLVLCIAQPCDVNSCPAYPEATCEDDYCGGCNARFFSANGTEVTDSCGGPVTCTVGGQQYEPGKSFPAGDGCNNCTCSASGVFLCTLIACSACPEGKVYQECGTACPLTCDNYNDAPLFCTLQCVLGCFCPTGEVEKGDECVEPSQCSVSCATILCAPGYVCQEFGSQGYCEPSCDPSLFDPPYYHCGDEQRCILVNGSCNTTVGSCPREVRCEDIDECELILCSIPFCGPNEPVTDDENCCPYCPPIMCPDDVPLVNCFADPCEVTECPLHPDAICYSDYCGGCNARFFYPNGEEVTETCNVCSLRADPGPCEAIFPSYFFNSETERCEEFSYGGCQGNPNRFETVRDCLRRCDNDSICLLRPDPGPCDANFPSYYYNATSSRCEEFVYGGCEGNRNRFDYSLQCYRTCSLDPCALVACEFPDCPGGEEPVMDDRQCCPYCPEPTCPADQPPVLCFADPCTVEVCPVFPDAHCVSDFCGGCNARFYDEDGEEVTDRCGPEPCPDDQLEVLCLVNPCTFAACPAYPEADCIPNYCGGCNARFYEDEEEVTAACEVDVPPSPTEYLACPALEPDAVGVCVEACSADSDCDEDYRCCSNGCGRSCQEAVPTQIPYYEPLLGCPSLSAQVGVCFSECQRDSDCDEDQLCCSNGCGQLCVRGQPSRPICNALRRRILSFEEEDRAVGVYIPQCQDDGSFAPVQCHGSTGYCWCVHTQTGEPMSTSPAPPGTNLQCQNCSYNGQTYYPGDSFPSDDGCNECGCSDNGQVFCTLRACVDPCSLPPDPGPCRAYFPAYYYNATIGKCQQFVYGGCEGNENKFVSNRDCLTQCQPDSFCLLDRDQGRSCDDSTAAESDSDTSGEPSYFYNATSGQCEFFLYGGCGGNENRFGFNIMDCLRTCDPDNVGPTDSTGQPCLLIQCDIPVCPGTEPVTDDTFCCPYCRPPTECRADEKRCSGGTCIPLSYVCDGLTDCPQGDDEPDGCDPDIIACEFRCPSDADDDDADESCIPESYVCDGFLDCPGGEDEMSCVTPISDIPYYEPPLRCPDSTGQLAICVEECRSNSDCDEDELCCPGACSGGICSRGVPITPACPALRELYTNRSSALYVPQCGPDGGFSPLQCHASTGCWCVNVQTGVPTSVATPRSDGNPLCDVCEYEDGRYAVGESFTAEDGCNTCVCTANGVLCTLVACAPAPCRVGDIEVRHGGTHEDDCSECSCLFGQLECSRRPCVVEPEALTAVTQVTLPFDGNFNDITATDDSREEFEREVRRTMVRMYRSAHGLMESQIQDIEFRRGSIIVIVYFTESEDQMQGANITILVNQMGQDYESGMLIIRYNNSALQPNGEFSTSVNVPTEDEEGLLWWHILLIVVGAVLGAGLVVVVAVVVIYQWRKKTEWKLASPTYSSPENAYENPVASYKNDESIELRAPSDYLEPIKA